VGGGYRRGHRLPGRVDHGYQSQQCQALLGGFAAGGEQVRLGDALRHGEHPKAGTGVTVDRGPLTGTPSAAASRNRGQFGRVAAARRSPVPGKVGRGAGGRGDGKFPAQPVGPAASASCSRPATPQVMTCIRFSVSVPVLSVQMTTTAAMIQVARRTCRSSGLGSVCPRWQQRARHMFGVRGAYRGQRLAVEGGQVHRHRAVDQARIGTDPVALGDLDDVTRNQIPARHLDQHTVAHHPRRQRQEGGQGGARDDTAVQATKIAGTGSTSLWSSKSKRTSSMTSTTPGTRTTRRASSTFVDHRST
jgi:hypothetical protein